jgi:hypothetical protein
MGCATAVHAGEEAVRAANAKRFKEQCQRDFEAFRKERLASGELECQKLINAAQAHLPQVLTLAAALPDFYLAGLTLHRRPV